MLGRVLGISSGELDLAAIERLVADQVGESQQLDFKRDLPGGSDAEKKEFAVDVAAMANGGGGLIIYGIEEDSHGKETAHAISPVVLGRTLVTLQSMVNERISPHLRVRFHEVEQRPGQGVTIADIPSPSPPYATIVGSRLGYPRRTGRNTHHMTEAEVALMYRSRFARAEDVRARLAEIAEGRQRTGVSALIPQVFLQGMPTEATGRLFRPSEDTKSVIRSIRRGNVIINSSVGNPLPSDIRTAFRRVDLAHGFEHKTLDTYGWMSFHDDGGFLAVVRGRLVNPAFSDDVTPGFHPGSLTVGVVAALVGFGLLLAEFGVEGNVVLQAGLDALGLPATLAAPFETATVGPTTADSAVETEAVADASDLSTPASALLVAKGVLDDVFSAFGWEGCSFVTADGALSLPAWGSDYKQELKMWATSNGVEVSD